MAVVTIVPVDDYSPIIQGDTGNPFVIQVLNKSGKIVSILGATITMKMQSVSDPTIIKTCVGGWILDVNDTGKASYSYQASDVNTSGSWLMLIKIVLNGKTVHPDDGKENFKILEILPLPNGA